MKLSHALCGVAVLAALGGTGYAFLATAQDTETKSPAAEAAAVSPVVARVNGEDIRQADVIAMTERLDPQMQQLPPQMLLPFLIDRIINTKLVGEAAEKANLETDPVVQKRFEDAKRQVLIETYLDKKVQQATTPEALKARYEEFVKAHPPQDEVKASHILVQSEDEAKVLLEQVKGGADFAALAKEKSIDPSAKQNAGELGYFTKDMMVEPFAIAAFEAQSGTFVDKPIQTQFGWHVIKVEDKRKSAPPAFEQAEGELSKQIAEETVEKTLQDLQANAKVERFNWDGSPLPAQTEAAPAPTQE